MGVIRRFRTAQQRGNAVLFSLIIIAAAMVISLGMVALVASEARTVGLVVPGEKAYYKAESFVEQALWQKKADQNYQVEDRDDLPATYLCENPVKPPPCFDGEASSPANAALKEFAATTSPIDDEIGLQPDVSKQFDILTTDATGTGSINLTNIVGEEGFRGLEATIIAYPKDASDLDPSFPVAEDNPTTPGVVEGATTAVFIDKVLIPPGNNGANIPDQTIDINQARQNALQENYPPFDDDSVYRIRLKALGAPATLELTAESTNGGLPIISPDFTVRSVAQDGSARRGLQVLLPASEQTASIFDFILFSDLDLDKIRSKVPGSTDKSITAQVYRDTDQDCVLDPGETGIPNVPVTAAPGYATTTNDDGAAPFNNLDPGTGYTVTVQAPPGTEFCPLAGNQPGNPQSFTFNGLSGAPNAQHIQMNFVVRTPLPPRIPVYYWFYCCYGTNNSDAYYLTSSGFIANYSFQGIPWYVYQNQQAGTVPLYRFISLGNIRCYGRSQADCPAGYIPSPPAPNNVIGYIYPYTGSCPAGSLPLRLWSRSPGNGFFVPLGSPATFAPWNQILTLGCAWSSP